MRAAAALLSLAALARAEDGFIPLFNGRNLDGWEGDPALWAVRDGAIAGSTDSRRIERNTFLIYCEPFSDFILRAEARLRNGNSGIQFRSTVLPGPGWVVAGYQADFSDAGERSAWGNFYEERGRGRGVMKTPDEGWRTGQKVFRRGGWNDYEIHAEGNHIRLTLNGTVTIDTSDEKARSGVIALQLHSGEPMQVEFRNLRIKPLPGAPVIVKWH